MEDKNEVQHLGEEQARDLAALEVAAGAGDVELLPAEGGQGAPAADPAAEWAGALSLVVAVASPLLPYLPAIYTPETCQRLGAAIAPVADKYGWDMGGICGEYAAEIGLAVVALPLLIQTRNAHADYKAELQRLAQEAADKEKAKEADAQGAAA